MIDDTKELQDVEMEHFDQEHPVKERAGNHMDSSSSVIEPPTLKELWKARANDRAGTQLALIIWLPKDMVTFDIKSALV